MKPTFHYIVIARRANYRKIALNFLLRYTIMQRNKSKIRIKNNSLQYFQNKIPYKQSGIIHKVRMFTLKIRKLLLINISWG